MILLTDIFSAQVKLELLCIFYCTSLQLIFYFKSQQFSIFSFLLKLYMADVCLQITLVGFTDFYFFLPVYILQEWPDS